MRKLIGLGVIAATAMTFAGCTTYMTITPSVQGRAYIVKNGMEMWNCDATSGDPVCYQTKQVSITKGK